MAREVLCPTCRQPTLFEARNRWRPFCSARCRGLDLGAWASEDYRVPATPPVDGPASSDAPADQSDQPDA